MVGAILPKHDVRFLESIISLKQWSTVLPEKGDKHLTRRSRWLCETYRRILSVIPIYFDRTHAFAGPLYGIQPNQYISNSSNEMEGMVVDFLRRQDRLGGPPTAVALVLDAVATSNMYPERGFRLNSDHDDKGDTDDPRILWPAIYLRSTVTTLRFSGLASGSGASTPRSSSSNLNLNHRPSPKASRKVHKTSGTATVLEYGPPEGPATSWPHSDWDTLVGLLDRRREEEHDAGDDSDAGVSSVGDNKLQQQHLLAVTYCDTEESTADEDYSFSRFVNAHKSTSVTPLQPLKATAPNKASESTFHLVSLSEWVTMVVLVKKEEGSRWHRKRSRLSDLEIQEFLAVMSRRLRVKDLFSASNLPPPQLPKNERTGEQILSIPSGPDVSWTDDGQVETFLDYAMKALGLRADIATSSRDTSRKGMQDRTSISAAFARMPSDSGVTQLTLNESAHTPRSAAELFLGPELFHLVE